MIPNTPPEGQVGVILGTVGVAGVAVAQLLGRDAVVVRFPPAPAGQFRRSTSLDISVLVRGMVDVKSESFPERQLPLDGTCFTS